VIQHQRIKNRIHYINLGMNPLGTSLISPARLDASSAAAIIGDALRRLDGEVDMAISMSSKLACSSFVALAMLQKNERAVGTSRYENFSVPIAVFNLALTPRLHAPMHFPLP
jgi:hypothetical protein